MSICKSGGAIGADTAFELAAAKAGHRRIHYSFVGHKILVPKNTIRVLAESELSLGEHYIAYAAKVLGRKWSDYKGSRRKLIQRNFWQINGSESVYAVAKIKPNGLVDGGTGWAVTMAILKDVPNIFVYDIETNAWKRWYGKTDPRANKWYAEPVVPAPTGIYAGIGTRNLTPAGNRAIEALYE